MAVQHKPSGAIATRDTRGAVMALVGGVACGGAVQRPLLCVSPGHEDHDAHSRYAAFDDAHSRYAAFDDAHSRYAAFHIAGMLPFNHV
jgi:hypothetical protein